MMHLRRPLIAFILVAAGAVTALAQEHPGHGGGARSDRQGESQQESQQSGPGVLALLPPDAVTEHSIDVKSGKLAYTATAGTFPLFDQSGSRSAQIFYTAYVGQDRQSVHAAGDFCLQRRAGRGIGVPQSRTGRATHRRIRRERP